MLRGFKKLVLTVSVALFVLALVAGYAVEEFLKQGESCVLTISYDNEVIFVLQGMLVSLQRAESSRRGYVITSNKEYVANYNEAVDAVQHSIAYLKQLNVSGQYQDAFLDSLGASIAARITSLKSSIELEMSDSAADSAQAAFTMQGMEAMSSLRTTILALERQKRDSQDEAFRSIGRLNASMRSLFTSLLMTALVIVAGFVYLSLRRFRRLESAESQTLRELFYARQQAQHFTTQYQDLKAELKEKRSSADSGASAPQ